MATDRVTHFAAQSLDGIGLGEDGLAKGAGGEAAFTRFFYGEHDFLHGISP